MAMFNCGQQAASEPLEQAGSPRIPRIPPPLPTARHPNDARSGRIARHCRWPVQHRWSWTTVC